MDHKPWATRMDECRGRPKRVLLLRTRRIAHWKRLRTTRRTRWDTRAEIWFAIEPLGASVSTSRDDSRLFPHHLACGSVPRRFDRVKLGRTHKFGEDRPSCQIDSAVPWTPAAEGRNGRKRTEKPGARCRAHGRSRDCWGWTPRNPLAQRAPFSAGERSPLSAGERSPWRRRPSASRRPRPRSRRRARNAVRRLATACAPGP